MAPPPAAPEEPALHLVVSIFFMSMAVTGVLLALLCHCYGGTCDSTAEMATIVSMPEEGPDHPEEDVAGAPKEATDSAKVEHVSGGEL